MARPRSGESFPPQFRWTMWCPRNEASLWPPVTDPRVRVADPCVPRKPLVRATARWAKRAAEENRGLAPNLPVGFLNTNQPSWLLAERLRRTACIRFLRSRYG